MSEDAYAALAALKKKGESFSDVVRRISKRSRPLAEFAGAWKDVPKAKLRKYFAFLETSDALSREKLHRQLRKQ